MAALDAYSNNKWEAYGMYLGKASYQILESAEQNPKKDPKNNDKDPKSDNKNPKKDQKAED